ncbi:MAG: SRPBCC family protein [Betaproteobacteria bacterium]
MLGSSSGQDKQAAAGLDVAIEIAAPAGLVLRAFFDPQALGAWWQTTHAVTTPRSLGVYAVQWAPTEFRDDLLGRLGGVFHGTVVQFTPERGFFVADAYWLPPDGDPIGPMALEVACTPAGPDRPGVVRVHVTQRGCDESERWRRYYEVISFGWERALVSLKSLLEK